MTKVLKISKAGKSITSAEPRDFIFNSEFPSTLKIVKENKGTLTISASTYNTAEISHDLDYVPVAMIFVECNPGSGKYYCGIAKLPSGDTDRKSYVDSNEANTYVTDEKLYIRIVNTQASEITVKYYYYLFGETAEY